MRSSECEPRIRVRITNLGKTYGVLADPKYLANRREGAEGILVNRLLSDTDFWWVHHADGSFAPYTASEMEKTVSDGWDDSPLG